MRRLLFLCVLFSLSFLALQAMSPPLPDQRFPPIGWESRITPGFDPPIEYYVAYGQYDWGPPARSVADVLKAWGPNAFSVLHKLSDDPGWASYRNEFLNLMQSVDSPEKVALFTADAEKLLAASDQDKPSPELNSAIYRLASADYPAYTKFIDTHLPAATPVLRENLVNPLFSYLTGEHADDALTRLTEFARTASEGFKKNLELSISEINARKRADEPMQKILDAERSKEKKP